MRAHLVRDHPDDPDCVQVSSSSILMTLEVKKYFKKTRISIKIYISKMKKMKLKVKR
jgi:hypothetical protein